MDLTKFHGILPAMYACYDDQGNVSEERTLAFCHYLYEKKIDGLYVGGSSGECIYQNQEERKAVLAYVAKALKGKLVLIAHVGAPSTRDSVALAQYAAELGYDALSAIPPIYFKFPDHAVENYWNEIINATPLPFIIYNIPQTTGFSLSTSLFERMLQNKKVIGVKNSSMAALDIERFKRVGGDNVIVFNGPDEQFVAGRLMGAEAGIGGTYAVMPELFLQANRLIKAGNVAEAGRLQSDINDIIIALCSLKGSMYAGIKEILKRRGMNIGDVRGPLVSIESVDLPAIAEIMDKIDVAIQQYVVKS